MSGMNQGGYRNVQINYGTIVTDAIVVPAAPLDFYKAVNKWVEEREYQYNKQPSTIGNLTALTILLYGRTPYDVYKATVTATASTGLYNFTFVGAYQTVEQATA